MCMPVPAFGVNAAGVMEAEIVSADTCGDLRGKAAAAQAAIAELKRQTENLQAHFGLGQTDDWDGFTVFTVPEPITI